MNAKQKICLFVIDPQNDFVNRDGKATLPVKGAIGDMDRLAYMVNKNHKDIDEIEVTLDSHYHYHIAHSCFTVDKNGNHPKTDCTVVITEDMVKTGEFKAFNPAHQQWLEYYVWQLKKQGRYELRVWPDHCLIGSPGQLIDPKFYEAMSNWENTYTGIAPRVTKGSNWKTEHFSAVKADVEDPNDPMTRLNESLIRTLKAYDIILIAGEALSHCVCNSIRDVAAEFSVDQIKKFVLLEDASSNVPYCEKLGEDFVNEMVGKGMQISKTTTFFK